MFLDLLFDKKVRGNSVSNLKLTSVAFVRLHDNNDNKIALIIGGKFCKHFALLEILTLFKRVYYYCFSSRYL